LVRHRFPRGGVGVHGAAHFALHRELYLKKCTTRR
jgi:hypothetical protein